MFTEVYRAFYECYFRMSTSYLSCIIIFYFRFPHPQDLNGHGNINQKLLCICENEGREKT